MTLKDKKAQGLGGLLNVLIIGIVFFAFFPFLSVSLGVAEDAHTGAVKALIGIIIFLPVYFFARFAFNLGADN